jgi:hypothetical protein
MTRPHKHNWCCWGCEGLCAWMEGGVRIDNGWLPHGRNNVFVRTGHICTNEAGRPRKQVFTICRWSRVYGITRTRRRLLNAELNHLDLVNVRTIHMIPGCPLCQPCHACTRLIGVNSHVCMDVHCYSYYLCGLSTY